MAKNKPNPVDEQIIDADDLDRAIAAEGHELDEEVAADKSTVRQFDENKADPAALKRYRVGLPGIPPHEVEARNKPEACWNYNQWAGVLATDHKHTVECLGLAK